MERGAVVPAALLVGGGTQLVHSGPGRERESSWSEQEPSRWLWRGQLRGLSQREGRSERRLLLLVAARSCSHEHQTGVLSF